MSAQTQTQKRAYAEPFMDYVINVLELTARATENAKNACQAGAFESCDFALSVVEKAVAELRQKIAKAREAGLVGFSEL